MTFVQTGQYKGLDGMIEYLSLVNSDDGFIFGYNLIGALFLDMTGTTADICVARPAERRQMPYNSRFLNDTSLDMCVDVVVGSTLTYTP